MSVQLPFDDRLHAARLLAEALAQWRGRHPLVLALPRGAVPMGRVIADALGGELDIVQVRKIGAPFNPEYALGAVDESGWRWLSPALGAYAVDPATIDAIVQREMQRMRERRAQWCGTRQPVAAEGRVVIVVDDGLATGASMLAALHAVRAQHPALLVCAVAVASPESLERVRPHADDIVCLAAPPGFQAVGQFYRDFRQVEDAEVAALLRAPA